MTSERFSRQILYKNIGIKGQETIKKSHVLIIGMGALGTHVAEGLVRSGVGTVTLVDRDYIEISNLQRQTLFTEHDAEEALPKAIAAENALKAIDSNVHVHSFIQHVDRHFLDTHASDVNLIIDATDNFETRQLINDFAYQNYIPWIYGGVVQSTYVETAFVPGETPCFHCLMPQLPAISMTCDTVGVIQPAVTMATSFQLRDALKILLGQNVAPKLTYGDIWEGSHQVIGYSKVAREDCPTCGEVRTYPFLERTERRFATLCGRDTVQYQNENISREMLEAFLSSHNIAYKKNDYMLYFKYKGYRIVSFNEGRMLIHGMTQPEEAYTLVHQLFG